MCAIGRVVFFVGLIAVVKGQCSLTIRRGSQGECVKAAQKVVGVSADGIFGRNTEAAVKDYQSCFGLTSDGIIGPNTWSRISGVCSRVSCSLIKRGSSKSACVKLIQRHVNASPVDGAFGPGTEAKVKAYQQSKSLSADGMVGTRTWSAMLAYSGSVSSPSLPSPSSGSMVPIPNSCGCAINRATGCSDGPTAGARQLASYLKAKFGSQFRTEIYNCRTIRGSSTSYSLHAEGRAVDLYITTGQGGSRVMDHLEALGKACKYGIQEVIYNRQIWSSSRPTRRAYTGSNPHIDHVHVGLNRCGARAFSYRQA